MRANHSNHRTIHEQVKCRTHARNIAPKNGRLYVTQTLRTSFISAALQAFFNTAICVRVCVVSRLGNCEHEARMVLPPMRNIYSQREVSKKYEADYNLNSHFDIGLSFAIFAEKKMFLAHTTSST